MTDHKPGGRRKKPPVKQARDNEQQKSIAPAKVPQPEHQELKPQTENMEVHHHPEVEKKGIKEYLLEGLMIFLAVFMGFIAENIREDYTEHQKAKAYAATMLADIKSDTSQLKSYIAYYTLANRNVDTLMSLLAKNDIKQVPTGKLYFCGLWGGARNSFIPNDATFQQMKSTGSLQYFERSVARKAAQYDGLCRKLETADNGDALIYAEVRKLRAQLFAFQYNKASNDVWQEVSPGPGYKYPTKKADLEKVNAFSKSSLPLLSYDRVVVNQYVELVRSRYMDRKVSLADTILKHADRLIESIKKQYPDSE